MIPYFTLTTITIGPVHIFVWGLFIAVAFISALWLAIRRARATWLNPQPLIELGIWIMVAAFIGARLSHVFLYQWEYYRLHPGDIIKLWEGGASSFGGFVGAAIAALVYVRIRKINFWQYADVIMFAFPLGLGIGRFGCFITHLHIGRLSSLPIAVEFPGGSRLDMGLLESLFGFALFGLYAWLLYRKRWSGRYLPLTMVIYGIVRFFLDFGRATDIVMADTRYLGLTPAQYGSLLLVIGGMYIWYYLNNIISVEK